jgi:hypothetical protein
LPFTEFYRRKDENTIGGSSKRKGNLSSAFEKTDSQLKYIFGSWHSRTKAIFEVRKKFRPKIEYLKSRKSTRKIYVHFGFSYAAENSAS